MKIDQYEEKLKYLYEAQEYLNQNKFPKHLMNIVGGTYNTVIIRMRYGDMVFPESITIKAIAHEVNEKIEEYKALIKEEKKNIEYKETEQEFENDIQYYLNALYKTGKKLGFDKKDIGHMIINNVMLR